MKMKHPCYFRSGHSSGMVSGLGCAAQTMFPSFPGSSLPPHSLSRDDRRDVDKLSFQIHASVPTDFVRPGEGKSFLLGYKSFSFQEHSVILSPKGDFPANNNPCRPRPGAFVFKPS